MVADDRGDDAADDIAAFAQIRTAYCGAAGSYCPSGLTPGQTFLGGIPLFKYNRAMLEYDF